MASSARLALRLGIAALFTVGLAVACSESPTGPDEPASFEELERELESSGHRNCLNLVVDLRTRLGSTSPGGLFGEILDVAQQCVAGANTGTIMVVVSTTGEGTDSDGYRVEIGREVQAVGANGATTITGLEPGLHAVRLSDVASNCQVVGSNPEGASVEAHQVAEVAFEVECGASGDTPVGDGPSGDDPPESPVSCPDVAFATTSGVPLDRIAVGEPPEEFEPPLAARVTGEDGAGPSFTFVHLGPDGTATLVSPIHPTGSVDGGAVQLAITDGTLACPPVDFTIEPLPPAPGELAAVVDEVAAILRDQAIALGTTPEAIASTPIAELEEMFVPLAVVQGVVDHPSNPNSLAAVAEGSAPDGNPLAVELLGRLFARTGLKTALAGSGTFSARKPRRSLDAAAFDAVQCTTAMSLGDAALLDFCMETARAAAFRVEGASGKVLEDLGTVFGVVGLAPVPPLEIAAGAAGGLTWAVQNERRRTAARLPSAFFDMDVSYDPTEFLEDQPGPGSWSEAKVWATNLPWDMGKELLEAVMTGAQVARPVAKFATSANRAPVEDFAVFLATPVANELLEISGGTFETFQLDVHTFGPVDVSDDTWSESRVASGTSIELVSHTDYEPREPGISTLSVRTEDGEFGGQQIAHQQSIEVKQLDIDIAPAELVVEEGEHVFGAFTVTVTDAHDPAAVEIEAKNGAATITYNGDGTHTVDYTAPASSDLFPDLVTARHTAETGARNDGPPRVDTADVRLGSITISPRSGCLESDETLAFTAEVEGLSDTTVEWSADVGDIDDNGLYVAPSPLPESSTATITATSASNPDIDDSVTIELGGCDLCQFDVSLSGGLSGVGQGPANFGFEAGVLSLTLDGDQLVNVAERPPGDQIQVGVTAAWDGEPGSVVITKASAANRTTGGAAGYDPDDPVLDCAGCGGIVTIDEATPELITGSLGVTLRTFDSTLPPTTATATFRASLATVDPFDFDPYRACLSEWFGGSEE